MIKTMLNRRSIRKYKSTEIAESTLHHLLQAAIQSSNVGNMQGFSIIINKTAEAKARIAPIHYNQPMITGAPVVLTFCADYNRFNKWCALRDAESGNKNFHAFLNAMTDALLVAQSFCNAAEAQSLGICYLGTDLYNPEMSIELLKLPKGVFPITTVAVGYPDEMPEQTNRLPIESFIHDEYYHNYSDDEIEAIYAETEALEENRNFVIENDLNNLAQVFTQIRYNKDTYEKMSKKLLQVLKKQGFISE